MIPPLIVAHRGASRACRENTLDAFRTAAAMGADMVELDVRRSADGALVVHHDPVADGAMIASTPTADLPAHIPSLAQALDACVGVQVNIEIKNHPGATDFDPDDTVAAGVVALLQARGDGARMLISSFNPTTIAVIRHLEPALRTGYIYFVPLLPLAEIAAAGHIAVHPHEPTVTEALVAAAHTAGLAVNAWVVDDPDRMRELAAWGVDAIITKVPDIAASTLRSS